MPALLIQSSGTAQLAGIGSTNIVMSSNLASGNAVFVSVNLSNASVLGTVSSITDNLGNSYSQAAAGTRSALLDIMDTELWYATNIIGGVGTVTINHTIDNTAIYVREYSGIQGIAALDIAGSANGTSASPNTGTVNTANANDLLIVATGDSGGTIQTWTAAGGYGNMTGTATTLTGLSMEDKTVSGTAAQTGTLTLGASANWTGLLAAFKIAQNTLPISSRSLLGVGK